MSTLFYKLYPLFINDAYIFIPSYIIDEKLDQLEVKDADFLVDSSWRNRYVDEVLAGRIDAPLTEFGRQQAQRLAEMLGQKPIRAIYSSPMCRAVETAQPLAEAAASRLWKWTQFDPGRFW